MDPSMPSKEPVEDDKMELDGAQPGTVTPAQTPAHGATGTALPGPSHPPPPPPHFPFAPPPLPFGPFPFPPPFPLPPITQGGPPMPFPFPPLPPFGLPPPPAVFLPPATPNHPLPAPHNPPTGSLLIEITPGDVTPSPKGVHHHLGFETICSYNWVRSPLAAPTIYVPGAPRKFVSRPFPISLRPSNSTQFVNENTFRSGTQVFEPVFQAMAIMKPDLRLNEIDVVSDRGSMKRLFDFSAKRVVKKPLHIAAQRIKNSLFLRLYGARLGVVTQNSGGYGRIFEEALTKDAMGLEELACGFHRVVKYPFGELTVLLRHEVDAYYEGPQVMLPPEQPPARDQYAGMEDVGIKGHPGATRVTMKGKQIPDDKVAEIKTGKNRNHTVQEMWFGRTPWLIRGVFDPKKEGSVTGINATNKGGFFFDKFESREQESLRWAAGLLKLLKEIVENAPGGKVLLKLPESGDDLMQVWEMTAAPCMIPEAFVERFWAPEEAVGGVDDQKDVEMGM